MQSNRLPNPTLLCGVESSMRGHVGYCCVGAADFEALGVVVGGAGSHVVEEGGGEEEGRVDRVGIIFVRVEEDFGPDCWVELGERGEVGLGECFGVDVDSEAVG